jgi:hypothetical protein
MTEMQLHDETEAPDALQQMRAKLRANGIIAPKAERKAREKKARSAVDGRSLRTKGRTAQLNVRIRPEAKEALLAFLEREGVSFPDWMEETIAALSRKKALAA